MCSPTRPTAPVRSATASTAPATPSSSSPCRYGPDPTRRTRSPSTTSPIDIAAGTVTCPGGHTVAIATKGSASFGRRCTGCPLRARCTRAKRGQILKVHPNHDQLATARRVANDEGWQATYRHHRPMVERTIAWLAARGHRRVRFRGIACQPSLAHAPSPVHITYRRRLDGLRAPSTGGLRPEFRRRLPGAARGS